jgi:hypothetical protein
MAGISSNRTLLYAGQITPASPEVFTAVANINDINGIKVTAETVDTSTHNNTDGYREFITSLKNGGDVTFKVNWDPTNATHNESSAGLLGLLNGGNLINWQIREGTITPVKQWTFIGVVTVVGTIYAVAGKMEADITIKVSGKPNHG